jgi:hypothetical protein
MPSYSARDLVDSHVSSFFEDDEVLVFDEIESPDFHMDVYLVKPDAASGRGFFTLLTNGVSGIPMAVPDPRLPAHVELMMLLPEGWPFEGEAWKRPENYWPIELVKDLGRFPHANKTWIGVGHTIPESEGSYLHQKGFVATVLLKATCINEEFQRIDYEGGYVDILMPVPLYEEEYEYKKRNGIDALAEKLLEKGFPDVVDLGRPRAL